HLERHGLRVQVRRPGRLERFALSAVRVALDGDVDQSERELPGALDLSRQEDEPRARAEDRLAGAVEFLERGHEAPGVRELEQGRGLTTRHDEPVDLVELLRLAHLDRFDPTFLQRAGVEREVALEGEYADSHRCSVYQPLV